MVGRGGVHNIPSLVSPRPLPSPPVPHHTQRVLEGTRLCVCRGRGQGCVCAQAHHERREQKKRRRPSPTAKGCVCVRWERGPLAPTNGPRSLSSSSPLAKTRPSQCCCFRSGPPPIRIFVLWWVAKSPFMLGCAARGACSGTKKGWMRQGITPIDLLTRLGGPPPPAQRKRHSPPHPLAASRLRLCGLTCSRWLPWPAATLPSFSGGGERALPTTTTTH